MSGVEKEVTIMRLVGRRKEKLDLAQHCFEKLPSILWSVLCGTGPLSLPLLLPCDLKIPDAPNFSTHFVEVVSTEMVESHWSSPSHIVQGT